MHKFIEEVIADLERLEVRFATRKILNGISSVNMD